VDRHWDVLAVILMGALLMLFYQRSGALWPAVLAHYLADMVAFAPWLRG
jgi:membrane protease YdiL (CAAX protease family)